MSRGRARPVTLGTETFPTQKSAVAKIRNVLYSYDRGERLVGDDYTLIRNLLDLHSDAEGKIGVGVSHIEVDRSPNRIAAWNKKLCFYVCRIDGTSEDFSFHHCLNNNIKLTRERYAKV